MPQPMLTPQLTPDEFNTLTALLERVPVGPTEVIAFQAVRAKLQAALAECQQEQQTQERQADLSPTL